MDHDGRADPVTRPLLAGLTELGAQKKDLTDPPVEHITRLRGNAADAAGWRVGLEPFVVIVQRAAAGSVFESVNDTVFTVVAAPSAAEAERTALALGPDARVFRVQSAWSRPKDAWAAANPTLWPSQ